MHYILIITGAAGLWVCLWLWRAGWGRRKKYTMINRQTVADASKRNFKK